MAPEEALLRHLLSTPETLAPPTVLEDLPVGGRLKHFVPQWEKITSDPWVLKTVRKGLILPFISPPPLSPEPINVKLPKDPQRCECLLKEVDSMERKGAVKIIKDPGPGLYSHLFTTPKKSGGWRPVIDLKRLNKFLSVPHFKMETAQSIRKQLNPFEWVVTLDMKDAYFHVPVHKSFQKYLRFAIRGVVYQFVAMCFGLASAPLIFTKILRPFAMYLRKLAILIHLYLDDWLIRAKSPEELLVTLKFVLELAKKLGILMNWEKSELTPKQLFVHLGLRFDLTACLVFPTMGALNKISQWISFFKFHKKVSAKAFLSF